MYYRAVARHEVVSFVSYIENSIRVSLSVFVFLGVFVFVFSPPDQCERTLGVCNGLAAVMKLYISYLLCKVPYLCI